MVLFRGQQLIPIALPIRREVPQRFSAPRTEPPTPAVIRRGADLQLRKRLAHRHTATFHRPQDFQLPLGTHANVPGSSYMPRLFLYFIVSRTDSASAFFSVAFSSFSARTSLAVASRWVSRVSPFLPASKNAFDQR